MPKFIVKSGANAGLEIPLTGKRLVFGRSDECDVVLTDGNVSRVHAHAIVLDGLVALVDLNSSNGTYVNELPISRILLMDGDEVRLGETVLVFSDSGPGSREFAGAALASAPRLQVASAAPAEPKDQDSAEELNRTQLFAPIPDDIHVEALKEIYLKLKALYRVFQEVSQAESLQDMFEAVGRALTISTGAERVVFFLNAEKSGEEWHRFLTHTASKVDERQAASPVSEALLARARSELRLVQAHVTADGVTDFSQGKANAIGAPVTRGGKLLAVLYVDNPATGEPFTKDDADFIYTLSLQLAVRLNQVEQVQQLKQENVELRRRVDSDFAIIVRDEKMKAVMALAQRVAGSDSTVLVTGESGTGKELVARAIHHFSPRSGKPLIAVNCAALPETLLESELFGHEKGAFTGALERRIGKFELADGGTLFLDEIGDISAAAQAKLLRALQEGEITRVGGTKTIKVDVRLITATNKNLAEEVKHGRFRQDLFFRLRVIDIELPPLRQRRDDIPVLAEHFLKQLRQKVPTRVRAFSPEAMEILKRYSFPGNVRELRNLVERALVFATGEVILPEHFPTELVDADIGVPPLTTTDDAAPSKVLSVRADGTPLPLAEVERDHIMLVLRHVRGNKLRAAALLGISRTTLYEKLKLYGLTGDGPAAPGTSAD